jgi:hypothetical protein
VLVNGQGAPGASASTEAVAAITHELDEQGLSVDAWLPWDARALRASARLGVPLALARPRGRYAKTLQRFIESVLVSTTPQPITRRHRLRPQEPSETRALREVALPWRR